MFNNNKKDNKASTMGTAKRNKNNDSNLSSVNMVSEGTEIIGKLITQSDIRIAGKVDGEAKVEGKIMIASTGLVDGNINAVDADIAGRVEGEVHVSNKLTLRQSAVVEGDLYAQSLVVEEGATFNGGCHMRDYASGDATPSSSAKKEQKKASSSNSDDEDTVAA